MVTKKYSSRTYFLFENQYFCHLISNKRYQVSTNFLKINESKEVNGVNDS